MSSLRDFASLRNCLGAPLQPEEQGSLLRCLDSANLNVDTCLVDGLPVLYDHLMRYIEVVAYMPSDDLELVEGAMLLVEQLALALGSVAATPTTASADALQQQGQGQGQGQGQPRFQGQWQMLVTTGGGWPAGRVQYVPIIELFEVSEDGRRFRLESKAGPLYTVAGGDLTWVHGDPNHLQYHVSEFRVELAGLSLPLPAPQPDNDLRVFAAAASIALARSSMGGMQLMGRPV